MRPETAIGEALRNSGIESRDIEFDIAIAKYLNSGGTIDGAIKRLDVAAERMSGMGQRVIATDGQISAAQTRQPVEGGEAGVEMPNQGLRVVASPPSFNRGGDGQYADASNGRSDIAVPAREPTQQQRDAAQAARIIIALTIMDTLKIDGRSIGNWTVGEARKAGRLKTREGYILIEASRVVANANGNELLRHVVKPKELQRIIQKAAEVADAV